MDILCVAMVLQLGCVLLLLKIVNLIYIIFIVVVINIRSFTIVGFQANTQGWGYFLNLLNPDFSPQ